MCALKYSLPQARAGRYNYQNLSKPITFTPDNKNHENQTNTGITRQQLYPILTQSKEHPAMDDPTTAQPIQPDQTPDKTPDITANLSIAQEDAIELLLQGHNDRQVAEAINVNRMTVCDWRN